MSEFRTNFIGCSSRGGQHSDNDFLVSAWNFANNVTATANCQTVIVSFQLKCPPGVKIMLFGSNLKQK